MKFWPLDNPSRPANLPAMLGVKQGGDMPNKKKADDERMRGWLGGVGGNIFIGDSNLKSTKVSKDDDKLTIVLKKKKQKKNAGRT